MTVAKRLGAGAVVLGLAAPFAGSPYMSTRGHIDVDDIARVIANGEDHVAPLDLARWIRERRADLRVIDVRPATEFAQYSIPTAENIPLDRLPRSSFAADDTIVLYSEGGAHAAQAWMMLRAMGHRSVYFISGGLVDWEVEVMSPVLPADAGSDARIAFERTAELSRYFGGDPQVAAAALGEDPGGDGDSIGNDRSPGASSSRSSSAAASRKVTVRRRGC